MQKKKALTAGIALAAIVASTLTFAAVNWGGAKVDFSTLKTAVETNNYASLSTEAKAKITEAQFAKMVEHTAEQAKVEAAITAGDYNAFRDAKIAEIPTAEEFQTMVTAQKARTAMNAAIETAVKNNDFAAFQAAQATMKTQMDAAHPDDKDSTRPEPSETQMKKHFDKLVTYYKTNGTLPEMGGKWFGGGFGEGGHRGGGHGPNGGGPRGQE